MKRVDNKKNLYKSIILLVLLVIGIGYAYLTSNLSITGATEVVANTWDIHFENLNVTTGSVTASTPAEIDSNETSITYAITLSRPKEYYEFTVDVVNEGTLPGKVSISELSGLDTASSKVIDYSIKYTNGNPVNVGDILNAGATKTIKVRVYYKDDISSSDFPVTDLNLNLTYTLQYIQSEEDEVNTNTIVQELKTNNTTCFTKYAGQITDQVGQTVSASNVYFNKCADKRNIIFNNMCFQMIRTTETNGIKMIYNGDVVDGKCESTRGDHKGIVQSNYATQTLSSNYLYGSSFIYDNNTDEFTLVDTITAKWNNSTYEDLIGMFTCKNSNGVCTTMYQINGYSSSTQGFSGAYSIIDTNYALIAKGSYNANYRSPAMVGYMFNKVYNYENIYPVGSIVFGNDVSYSNGTYTLLPASGETELGTELDNAHHYTCMNNTGTCNKVRYYYYKDYYIELENVENIQTAVNQMLYDDNVNRYNSSIKGIIDSWYAQNLKNKTGMLEDTVYCNARNMSNQSTNGWNKDGDLDTELLYKNSSASTLSMECPNITDQFAISNNKAKLIYPVGLLQNEERANINTKELMATGVKWWEISPYNTINGLAGVRFVNNTGINGVSGTAVENLFGIRPVISLKNGATISKGDGSETNPWIVE